MGSLLEVLLWWVNPGNISGARSNIICTEVDLERDEEVITYKRFPI
jgi:hypothetical protein